VTGVIATLAINARAARKQAERHWAKEASSVGTALRGEIEQLKSAMSNQGERLGELEDQEEGGFLVPSRTIDVVYRSLIPQLGKLEPQQVEAVMGVYGQYGIYLDKLQLVGSPHQSGRYTVVPNEWRSVIAAHCGYVIEKAETAIRALE
jgi:hypothetical protein